MKFAIQSTATLVLAVLSLFSVSAQPGGGWQRQSPEERASQQAALMTEKLALSEAQAEKVKEISLKYSKKMQEAREANTGGDWSAMRETMTAMREEQDKEYQKVLTSEQWETWVKEREEMMKNRGPRPGGEEGRPRKKKEKTDDGSN
ncbi:MAG TPA: hypothetical protein PKE06_03750 [Flavilitoribacter sp.]|nr:hypothetical protein [Flavilitoribacter sp.]HMQ89017.1 hypothetical protein [Flavilitoribacter sp.]